MKENYKITITCVVPKERLHRLDHDEWLNKQTVVTVRAVNEEEALDYFHATYPIKVLEDFEITVQMITAPYYKVVVEASDGMSVLGKKLSKEEALKKASDWLGREMVSDREVSDHGVVISIHPHISDIADQVWVAISYSWKHTADALFKERKTDSTLDGYLEGLTDEQIIEGIKELCTHKWIEEEVQ